VGSEGRSLEEGGSPKGSLEAHGAVEAASLGGDVVGAGVIQHGARRGRRVVLRQHLLQLLHHPFLQGQATLVRRKEAAGSFSQLALADSGIADEDAAE